MLSPTLERMDDITVKGVPKGVLKIIGHFAGSDHAYKQGGYYFTCEKHITVQLGQLGVPFFSSLWPTKVLNKYMIKRVTPCSIDVTYIHTVYIVEINDQRFKIIHNMNRPDRKLMVCRRQDMEQQHVINRMLMDTEELLFDNIWERSPSHIVFLLTMEEYAKAGLETSWIHNIILAGYAMNIFQGDEVF